MSTRDDISRGLRTLRFWLCRASVPGARAVDERRPASTGSIEQRPSESQEIDRGGEPHPVPPEVGHDKATKKAGVLLPFPVHGEALLVKLAELLRSGITNREPERDPLLLEISRSSGLRLSIDRTAYVEFDPDRAVYLVVIEAGPDTKIMLDSSDFDAVVNFVVRYIAERPSASTSLEVSS